MFHLVYSTYEPIKTLSIDFNSDYLLDNFMFFWGADIV